ncbi:MAG: ATP-binding protein [Gammaproteobacteria bacterium]|nr:ATP-binding protein [Gammaproteobacteria bacterium]
MSTELRSALTYSPVVNVIGPRRVGKTTLVRDILQTGRFITLDDPTVLDAMAKDPVGQIGALTAGLADWPLVIDEAQRSGDMALAIKMVVDAHRQTGQFILTGSSNVFATMKVADSLAGRMRILKLWPLTVAEVKSRPPSRILDWACSKNPNLPDLPEPESTSRADYIDLILRGGFPETRNIPLKTRHAAYRNHVDTIVDRDVADLLRVRKTDALRKLIVQLAVRTGEILNVTQLCKLIGVQRQTAEQYLDVLLRLSIVVKLGAWASGEHYREIKNAKNHFVDTGMAAALRNLNPDTFDADANPAALGGLLESFVFAELLRSEPYQEHGFNFYHWRDQRGREIDVLAESGHRLITFEVKAASSVSWEDFGHMVWFSTEGPGKNRSVTSIIFYLGEQKLAFGENLFALPVSNLWSESNK